MNQYRQYGQFDDQALALGDRRFLRLDMRSDPATLPEGVVARSENFRFETNGAQVRGGIARQLVAGDTIEAIYCAGVYRPDNDTDRIACVNGSRLTLFNPVDQSTARYDYPAGETVTAEDAVEIIQGGVSAGTTPDLYILRGQNKSVLKFDGSAVSVAADFEPGDFGIFYQDRMAVNSDTWTVAVSDFLDFTTWNTLQHFQVLKGSDDQLVLLLPYQKDYVLIGTRKRWFIAHFDPKVSATPGEGYSGGLEDTSFIRELTREAGPVGKRAAHETNGLIWFITDRGIYTFQPRLDLELTVLGKPMSTGIQPVVDRISADFADRSCITHHGYRVYCAMPISGVPVRITGLTVSDEQGALELPFDLPAVLGGGYIVEAETEEDHHLATGDLIQIKGSLDDGLNGRRRLVTSVTNSRAFTIDISDTNGLGVGDRCYVQKIAERPNMIAVYNLALEGWESVDVLPSGLFADFLVIADNAGERRLWIVDEELGPCLYEEGITDEISDEVGGLALPFDLPAELSEANFGSTPIAGALDSRVYQWGEIPKQVKAVATRLKLSSADDAGTVTCLVRTPNRPEYSASKTFDGLDQRDKPVRVRSGRRGIEAQIQIRTTGGRPAVRSLQVEVANSGRDKED